MTNENYAARPLPSRDSVGQTAIRLALLRAGYVPLPSIGKQCKMRDWPRVTIDERFIRHIDRSALYTGSGIRINGDLIVFDVDTDIVSLANAIEDEIEWRLPGFMRDCVVRHSGGPSFALFGRCNSEAIGRIATARFKLEGKGRNHAVEILGPATVKFVAVSGPHTVKDGVVTRSYGFHGPALWEVPIETLPIVEDVELIPLLNKLEQIIAGHPGMVRTQPERHADRGYEQIYDLEDHQIMMMEDGTQELLRSLGLRLAGGGYEKGFANIWDPASTTPDRCRVGVGGKGVYVIDFKMEQTHHLARTKPFDRLDIPSTASMLKTLKGEK